MKTAYLMIHGFGGGLDETEYLVTFIKAKGLDVYSVLLQGHGGSKKDLKNSNADDWVAGVQSFLSSLIQKYPRVVVLGFSMGGLIAFHLASTPQVCKLVLINTPIYFWNKKIILKDIAAEIKNPGSEKMKYYIKSVTKTSVKSGVDFLNLLHKTKKLIATVKKPTLIIQCKNDESVHHKSAAFIKNTMGRDATLKYFEGGCHQLFIKSPELRDTVCRCIYDFLIAENPNGSD